ncbi:MAG TPA: protein kinase [Gemmatimonadales bacterium]|nr:protein kinase [Gemmatimonadales bacterium]
MSDPTDRLAAALSDRYKIERELGQGGMATVYLAEDLKHHREVAIKVLKPELAAVLGADRFVQEIQTTAALQHPHILPLFDSGRAEAGEGGQGRAEFLFYVMPYVEGETLRQKLDRETQFSIDDAVRITTEVADALDYAHRHGVVHRDIKPENILLHDGRPMVADFGIALALSAAAGGRMTETGMSLGTPHYMSPEQATADKDITGRSDIYSLASVLYEMLTGQPPHLGGSAQQIIMKIIAEDVKPVTTLRKSVPANVAAATAKALEKLPADRFDSAKAFAEALTNPSFTTVSATSGATAAPAALHRSRITIAALGATCVALAAVAAWALFRHGTPAAATVPPIQYLLATGDSTRPVANFPWPAAISPNGGTLVYSVGVAGAGTMFYALRSDQLEAQPIPGTAGAYQPFFSPDGAWLAFEQNGKERKVRLDGSQPVTITDASGADGATWTPGGDIVLGAQGPFHGLSRVSAAGGDAVALTHPDSAHGETDHLWPVAVPDGNLVAFTSYRGSLGSARLALASLADGAVTPLDLPGIRPLAVLDGMLVYVQADGTIMAVALDATHRRLAGKPIPVHDPVHVLPNPWNGNSDIYVSQGGALVASRGQTSTELMWVDLDGRTQPLVPQPAAYSSVRISPDGRRVAVVVGHDQQSDVWIRDLTLNTFSRLTTLGSVRSVDWSADGTSVIFVAGGENERGTIWSESASGGAAPKQLSEQAEQIAMATISPDGRTLVATVAQDNTWELFQIALDSTAPARPYVLASGGAVVDEPQFAPDGKWVALESTETGREEIYVRSFPDPSVKIQVSTGGGYGPRWSRDGTRLYYWTGSTLMAARVSLMPTFTILGRDTVLAHAPIGGSQYQTIDYDVTRDEKRVLGVGAEHNSFTLVVAPNWITEFRRRVAESRAGR